MLPYGDIIFPHFTLHTYHSGKKRTTNCIIGVKRSEFIKTINMLFLSHMILSLQDAKFKFPTTAGYFAAFCIIKIDILVHSLT